MKWCKQGLIYSPDGQLWWAKTHAIIPTPELIGGSIRLYHSSCDDMGIGRIGYIDVAAENPKVILSVSQSPLLDIGLPGTFDENGVLPTSILTLPDGKKYLYYVGFELGRKIRYRLLTGLAVSSDGGLTFVKFKQTPILERSSKELHIRGGSFVMQDQGVFKLWYLAGSHWISLNGKTQPVYSIHYLESSDGFTWGTEGHECLPVTRDDEYGFGRPFVVKENNAYKMFYSIRKKDTGYRLGYAESNNGVDWERKDELLGVEPSLSGWDSQAVCYSSVVAYRNNTYLFYNGNDFGRTGIGYAILENE
jgi:hypothetical protein